MIVTATDLASDSQAVLDRVLERNESALVQRQGRTVAEIRRKVGVDREEFLHRLAALRFTERDSRELAAAINAAAEVFGYAGRD